MATPAAMTMSPILDSSTLVNLFKTSKTFGMRPGAIAKKNPSNTATEPKANKILSITLTHFPLCNQRIQSPD